MELTASHNRTYYVDDSGVVDNLNDDEAIQLVARTTNRNGHHRYGAENNTNSKTPCQSSSRIIGNFLALLLSFCLGFFLCLRFFLQDGYTTNSVASRQEISRENHHVVNPPAHDVDPPASLERFMEDYWTASQMSYPHLTPMGSRTRQSMRQCVKKNGITVKFPSLPHVHVM